MYLLALIVLDLVGADGETHQGVFDIAFLRHIPNMVLMMPKDENEGQHMVNTAIQYNDGPIAMRFPRGNGYGVPMDEELKKIPIGTWEVLREGTDACHFNIWNNNSNGNGSSEAT